MIGQTISHYKITSRLGAGGMGEVFLADDTKLDRQVALKFLPASMWNESEAQQRLIREAKAASKLDHPNVVTIFGIEEYDGRPFIIMSHVRGVSLQEYCNAAPRTIDDVIDLALQMADGLQHAHEAGVIHRDLKSSNVLVDDRGRVRILDFGIARLRGTTRLTQAGSTVGTLAYSPPELARGKEAEPTSDIYSLGVVIYQMLTKRLPYEADHEAALLYSILNEAPLPLNDGRIDVPSELQDVVIRCLEKNPKDRFQSCAELASELKRCLTHAMSSDGNGNGKPSIAVLPFANMSADPENEYFSDGLSEELLNVLAKNPGLKVTGRTSSFAFKGKNEDLREIGQKLGVEHLLEGSVRKAGNRVRITTQLVKASDGFHLWSETYDRVLEDIFAVQDEIAQAVSEAMHVTLLGAPKQKPKTTVNPETFRLNLQARQLASQLSKASVAQAVEIYKKVISIDPNDARAWAGLSLCYGTQMGYGHVDAEGLLDEARKAAQRALELDDTLPEVHNSIGWQCTAYEYDWDRARRSFERAVELAPGDGQFLVGLGVLQSTVGNHERAVELLREAVKLDPLNPLSHAFLGRVQLGARRYEEALESYSQAVELSPNMTGIHGMRSATLYMMGRYDDALAEARKEKSTGYRTCALAIIHATLGQDDQSKDALDTLIDQGEQWGIQIALAHAARREFDDAFHWLDRSFEMRDAGISVVKTNPVFDMLKDDPRWPAFLKKIGLDK